MVILNRWIKTAQKEEQLSLPGAEKSKIPVELKKVKAPTKSGIGETPEQVEYVEDPAVAAKVEEINKLKEDIEKATAQADSIIKAAKTQAKQLESALDVAGKEAQVAQLLDTLHEGLIKLSGNATLMFRQAGGLIVALQKVHTKTDITPSDKEKLEFVKGKLETAGDLGKTLLAQLEEFSAKVKNSIVTDKNVVHMYPKPKSVKNQKNAGSWERLKDLIWSAGTSLAGAQKTMRLMLTEVEDAVLLLGGLEEGE